MANYIELKSCRSTNDELYSLALGGAANGTILSAESQTGGKGTKGRSFHSPKSGVYFSVLLREISNENMLDITPLAAVAVSKSLDGLFGTETKIKKVNDIYLDGKKVCGILTQAHSTGKNVDFIIVGIGVNLFKPEGGFPQELKDIAGSVLETEKVDKVLKKEVIEKIGETLIDGAAQIANQKFKEEMYAYYGDEKRAFVK